MIQRALCLIALLLAAEARAQVMPLEEPAMTSEQAAQMQAAQAATQSWYTRVAGELAASGEPRDLAFAATLLQVAEWNPAQDAARDAPSRTVASDPRIDQWRRLASARAGSDVLANVLLMHADSRADSQLRSEAAERWRKLEPDNLAPLLYNNAGIDAMLAAARSKSRFDLHYYDQARWMQSVLLEHPPSAAERAALSVPEDWRRDEFATIAGMNLLAIGIPAMQSLSEACRGDALMSTPARREDCRHVARVMSETSDTGIGTLIGIALLRETATTAQQRANADAQQRRLDWQMQQWARVSGEQPRNGAAQLVRLLRDPAIQSEQDLVERVLQEAGIPLDPLAGWQPPRRD